MSHADTIARAGHRHQSSWEYHGLTALEAGSAAGLIDFVYATGATVTSGGSWLRPWKGVVAATFGIPTVVAGGDMIVIVGIVIHFFISIAVAICLVIAMRRIDALSRHPIATGIALGALFLCVMNYVLLPLSVMGKPLYVGLHGLGYALLSHVLLIGLPISFIATFRQRSFLASRSAAPGGDAGRIDAGGKTVR